MALRSPETGSAAATALGQVPHPDAQRSLADVALDPSQARALRGQAATQLVRSIQRFGPLISADQEGRLSRTFSEEPDAEVRAGLQNVMSRSESLQGKSKTLIRPAVSV